LEPDITEQWYICCRK